MNFNRFPVIWLSVHGHRPLPEIMRFVDDKLKQQVESIPGCGGIIYGGWRRRNMRVWLDNERLQCFNLDAADVMRAVRTQHVEKPAGQVQSDWREFNVRTMGEARNAEEFSRMPLVERRGVRLRLGDVAVVEDGLEDKRTFARFNRGPNIGIGVMRATGANVVELCNEVKSPLFPDKHKMAQSGVPVQRLAFNLNVAMGGVRAGRFTDGDGRYDVRLRCLELQRASPDDLDAVYVKNDQGQLVPVSDLVTRRIDSTLPVITRYNHLRMVELTANVAPGVNQGEAIERCLALTEEVRKELGLPSSYRAVVLGNTQAMRQTMNSLWWCLTLGVDYANQLRRTNPNTPLADAQAAMLAACPVRLRPILMTSLATIASALPLALGLGPGAETRAPLARSIIGGIVLSTLVTLVIVPVFYVRFDRFGAWVWSLTRREDDEKPLRRQLQNEKPHQNGHVPTGTDGAIMTSS